LGAGIRTVAVATPFTRSALHAEAWPEGVRIVDAPEDLSQALEGLMEELDDVVR
jgi:hypothetical protein